MVELYAARPRISRLRGVMIVSLILAAVGVWLGIKMLVSYGLAPADGGILAPFGQRFGLFVLCAGGGIGFAAGMWAYGRLYVRSIVFDHDSQMLQIRTVGMFTDRQIVLKAAQVLRSRFNEGRMPGSGGARAGSTPWYSVWINGQRWPLILDAQGRICDRNLLGWLLKF